MIGLGSYQLEIIIGNTIVPIQPQMIRELTISQDIDWSVPMFKLVIRESTGLLGEVVPLDTDANTISIKITSFAGEDESNIFKFLVKRRRFNSNKDYVIEGILNVSGLFDPMRTRALSGNIHDNIQNIATDELLLPVADVEIGRSLQYNKTIIQPKWTNAQLFRYLKSRLIGDNDEAGFYCFIKNVRGLPKFVFKSINELVVQDCKSGFMIGPKQYEDYRPVSEYHVIDSSQFIGAFAAKTQSYEYFNFNTGSCLTNNIAIADYPSLAEQFLIADDDTLEGTTPMIGRNNSFTKNFKGVMKNGYFNRLTGLVNMWISTWGTENIAPGDITRVLFTDAFASGDVYLYQHSGFWLVKRVVHILTSSFMTNILLTRSGIDTSIANTLTPATIYKRQ